MTTSEQLSEPADRQASWGETVVGVIIFILFPLFYLFSYYFFPVGPSATWLSSLAGPLLFFTAWFVVPLLGFAVGWLKGFPRWSYPYVSFAIFIQFFLGNASTPGLKVFGIPIFGVELWGIRACLPGLLMVALMLALTRSPSSMMVFIENGWRDWTRFTYALFGLMPYINLIAFDEVRNSYEMPFQLAMLVIMALAAIAYLRSTTTMMRALSLLAGFIAVVAIDTIFPTLYWQQNGFVSIPGAITAALIVLLIAFSPALIGFIRGPNGIKNQEAG